MTPLNCIFVEHTEEADSEETLDSDEDGYPLLPENVLELRLDRRKAVMRQFMGAARRAYIPYYSEFMLL
jgi:hypothetical protein